MSLLVLRQIMSLFLKSTICNTKYYCHVIYLFLGDEGTEIYNNTMKILCDDLHQKGGY